MNKYDKHEIKKIRWGSVELKGETEKKRAG
jgi:hypothetical protein